MYLSELLQKPILSLYEGELLGNIDKVFFDKSKRKITALEILNEEGLSYCLHPKHIYTLGKNAITIKNKQNLTLSLNEDTSTKNILPMNVKVYSLQGEYLGVVQDYSLNEKFDLENIILDNQKLIPISEIASCSSTSMVVYYYDEHINIKAFRYKIQHKQAENNKVKVLPKLFTSFNKIATSQKTNFIVGRICTKDILDNQRNVIIKQNSTITEQTIALASGKNKLQELIKYSKEK